MFDLLLTFEIGDKLVESDHTPLIFEIMGQAPLNEYNDKTNDRSELVKRYRFIFDKNKVPQYKRNLKGVTAQDKLIEVTDSILCNADSDVVVNSMYKYLDHCIEPTFKKKYMRPATNKFPVNNWYDYECKSARKVAKSFSKNNDLTIPIKKPRV